MKRLQNPRLVIGLIVTLAVVGTPLASRADRSAPTKPQAKFEVEWMKDMINHHAMAVMVGELCLERAVHPELVEMCQAIVTTQMAEIEQMKAWLRDWYSIQYEPQMKPGDEKMIARLATLTGAGFEIAFMEMVIRHHIRAIREAVLGLRRGSQSELKELAANIIEAQGAEIVQMEEWRCSWYDRCGGTGSSLAKTKH